MKENITDKIIKILKVAGSIKDKVEPICRNQIQIPKKYISCLKCYPDQPERSKREDSQKCEMRCSEHCGNTVRDK